MSRTISLARSEAEIAGRMHRAGDIRRSRLSATLAKARTGGCLTNGSRPGAAPPFVGKTRIWQQSIEIKEFCGNSLRDPQ
jgi:hypothetical protein